MSTRSAGANSPHKLDTLIAALKVFRNGLVEEVAEYDQREKELEELKGEWPGSRETAQGGICGVLRALAGSGRIS